MTNINGKVILLGDIHFGVKKFSIPFLENTLSFFNEQMFKYMKENNIVEIIQLGDIFDNRTSADINFIHVLREKFFDVIVKNGFKLHCLVGNHDIFFKESREVTLVKMFRDIYPDNFILYENREKILVNNRTTYIVPWIVKNESLSPIELIGVHTVLGHFEVRNFAMVRGHIDETSELTEDFFENNKVKNVFSGHYHIKNTKGLVKYLGTPLQLNWNDYCEDKGFYVWDELDTLEFFENRTSKKFVKVKYNDENKDKSIEVEGLFKHKQLYSDEEFKELLPELEKHEVKFFVNKSSDRHYDELIYMMNESNITASVINNQEISVIIGTDYIDFEDEKIEDTRKFIISSVKEYKEELLPLLMSTFIEIDSNKNKE